MFCIYIALLLVLRTDAEQYELPQIIPNMSETIFNAGDNCTLICRGDLSLLWTLPEVPDSSVNWSDVITTETRITTEEYQYESSIQISNISFVYTGFFTCSYLPHSTNDSTSKSSENAKSTSIYVYVSDEEHLAVDDSVHFIFAVQKSVTTIPCRPTDPSINVTLTKLDGDEIDYDDYDPKFGFRCKFSRIHQGGFLTCTFYNAINDHTESHTVFVTVEQIYDHLPFPQISDLSGGHTVIGNTLTVKCSIHFDHRRYVTFHWTTPQNVHEQIERSTTTSMASSQHDPKTITQLLIINSTKLEDSGTYTCNARDKQNHSTVASIYIPVFEIGNGFIDFDSYGVRSLTVDVNVSDVQWVVHINSHPTANLTWYDNQQREIPNGDSYKYRIATNPDETEAKLVFHYLELSDYGNYTLVAQNAYMKKEYQLFLNVTSKPVVNLRRDLYRLINTVYIAKCSAVGNPQPAITWSIRTCLHPSCRLEAIHPKHFTNVLNSKFEIVSYVNVTSYDSGMIQCQARNSFGMEAVLKKFFVTDVKDGFNLFGMPNNVYYRNQSNSAITARGEQWRISCGVSIYSYEDRIEWLFNGYSVPTDDHYVVELSRTMYSNRSALSVMDVDNKDSGIYSCRAKLSNGTVTFKNITLSVEDPKMPEIIESNLHETIEINFPEYIDLYCKIDGLPKPTIAWYKDGNVLQADDRINFYNEDQKVVFTYTMLTDEGSYMCVATNNFGSTSKSVTVSFLNKPANYSHWYILAIIVLLVAITVASIYIIIKTRAERRLQRELKAIGLENFERGAVENINSDLGINDQAELLPYNRKWEFPIENLVLGRQLGAGAFGVVMKGEAKGILKPGHTTIVAVKMVKKNADNSYIKALASELKIMVHLGQHLNVVNLLGACTKNVVKRELLVIVEYCRYGNILNYLLRHRRNFVNQIDPKTGRVDYSFGPTMQANNSLNEPTTPSVETVIDSTMSTTELIRQETLSNTDAFPSNYNSGSDMNWATNYRGDYKGEIVPHLCTKDLLIWAFQIARGMEYLATRKVLHGDLAARNVLLADNNVLKICDFGLARNMYQTDNYKKRGAGPLPVKWMAIESIRDRVFSTQSDVWSFGIVLWELFSLGQTPYPGMEADERLYNKLLDGYRMLCPEFAPRDVFKIMTDCWLPKPLCRPSFTLLAERIGCTLEDSVTRHYIDLNDPYLIMNTETNATDDYLAMLASPNYENVTAAWDATNCCHPEEFTAAEASKEQHISDDVDRFLFDQVDSSRHQLGKTSRLNLASAEGGLNELIPMLPMSVNSNDCPTEDSDCDSGCNSPTTTSNNSCSNPSYHLPPILLNKSNLKDMINISSTNYVNIPKHSNKHGVRTEQHDSGFHDATNSDDGPEQHPYVNNCTRDWESVQS